MKSGPESSDIPLNVPLHKPQTGVDPKPETWTPTGTPGVERNQAGQVRTNIPEKSDPLALISMENREVWEDRYFFPGGDEEGYKSYEEAKEALIQERSTK